jgi:transcriptional regulator with XRE-family HTH domain
MRLTVGEEIRRARLGAGLSQAAVGRAAHISQSVVSDIEAGKTKSVSLEMLVVVADAVGLDLTCRTYPGRRPTRDAAHARKLQDFLSHVRPPLRYRLEQPLPEREGVIERRAWDAMLFARDATTGVELEMRLYDVQDQSRRLVLKWRDSGADRLLLLLNDTAAVRDVVRSHPDYFNDLPRLKRSSVLSQLERGVGPHTGYLLI